MDWLPLPPCVWAQSSFWFQLTCHLPQEAFSDDSCSLYIQCILICLHQCNGVAFLTRSLSVCLAQVWLCVPCWCFIGLNGFVCCAPFTVSGTEETEYLFFNCFFFLVCDGVQKVSLIRSHGIIMVSHLAPAALLLFSHSVVSNSLWPHGLQHARLPWPPSSPGACSNSCPLSWWCHPAISSSAVPFSCDLQSLSASGSFLCFCWAHFSGVRAFVTFYTHAKKKMLVGAGDIFDV